ncbi:MAG: PP2C family protein-serine/threonine phosphatase, partial [Deltaproteobacteria bacterium]
ETVTKERMEKELETAKLIQATLLSSTHINTDAAEVEPFYLSASECGGDIWDAYQTGTTLTVLVGDATGHGAAAAIVTAVAKSCFITLNSVYSATPLSPKSFLEQLNQVIYESCKGQLLMTMSVLQIDLSSGKALLSNAGHEAPLLLKAPTTPEHKNKCEPLFVRGERLGFAPDSKFENLEVQLGIGDTVLIYTDGISEAVNLEKKPFGERGIRKLFNRLGSEPLPEIKTQLFKELKDFMGETEQQDDITFLLVKWHHQLESQNPAPDSLYNKGESQRVISTPSPVLPPTEQKISLNELAKTSDFNEEEVDTHYSRIEDLENQDNDSSEGEAA